MPTRGSQGAKFPWNVIIDPDMERAWFFMGQLGIDLAEFWRDFDPRLNFQILAYFNITYPEWIILNEKNVLSEDINQYWGGSCLKTLI